MSEWISSAESELSSSNDNQFNEDDQLKKMAEDVEVIVINFYF